MQMFRRQLPLYLMVTPVIIFVLYFSYVPMVGLVIGFQNYKPLLGFIRSMWVGLGNFKYVLSLNGSLRVIRNTLYIGSLKIIFGLVTPIFLTLIVNELRGKKFKSLFQTISYVPHFMSWVILGSIFIEFLSQRGPLNNFLGVFGVSPIYFLGKNTTFPLTMVVLDTWKEAGFSTIVMMAALTGIDPALYEAAEVDGAGRWKKMWHISLPGMRPIIILVGTLNLGRIFSAGFDQIFTMYSPQVYESADIIDTFVYRLGFIQTQFGPATAVGIFQAAVAVLVIGVSYFLAYKLADYRIF